MRGIAIKHLQSQPNNCDATNSLCVPVCVPVCGPVCVCEWHRRFCVVPQRTSLLLGQVRIFPRGITFVSSCQWSGVPGVVCEQTVRESSCHVPTKGKLLRQHQVIKHSFP
jgi:hypothetical protein